MAGKNGVVVSITGTLSETPVTPIHGEFYNRIMTFDRLTNDQQIDLCHELKEKEPSRETSAVTRVAHYPDKYTVLNSHTHTQTHTHTNCSEQHLELLKWNVSRMQIKTGHLV